MDIAEAQHDLRRAYVGGGPGVFVSSLVWFSSGFVERVRGPVTGFTVLFFGGMLIFPLATLISRFVFQRGKAAADNSLGATALESTVAMIGGLIAAWLFLRFRPDFVFPLSAIAVGTHYAVFRSVYGDRLFLFLAAAITCVGLLGIFAAAVIGRTVIFDVALIELVFALILTFRAVRTPGSVKP